MLLLALIATARSVPFICFEVDEPALKCDMMFPPGTPIGISKFTSATAKAYSFEALNSLTDIVQIFVLAQNSAGFDWTRFTPPTNHTINLAIYGPVTDFQWSSIGSQFVGITINDEMEIPVETLDVDGLVFGPDWTKLPGKLDISTIPELYFLSVASCCNIASGKAGLNRVVIDDPAITLTSTFGKDGIQLESGNTKGTISPKVFALELGTDSSSLTLTGDSTGWTVQISGDQVKADVTGLQGTGNISYSSSSSTASLELSGNVEIPAAISTSGTITVEPPGSETSIRFTHPLVTSGSLTMKSTKATTIAIDNLTMVSTSSADKTQKFTVEKSSQSPASLLAEQTVTIKSALINSTATITGVNTIESLIVKSPGFVTCDSAINQATLEYVAGLPNDFCFVTLTGQQQKSKPPTVSLAFAGKPYDTAVIGAMYLFKGTNTFSQEWMNACDVDDIFVIQQMSTSNGPAIAAVPNDDEVLSVGAIAGIVVACVIVIAVIIAMFVCGCRRRPSASSESKKKESASSSSSMSEL